MNLYILFPVIPSFNFWYFDVLKMSFVDFACSSANDMTTKLKNQQFFTRKTIYIWKVLLERFRITYCMMPNVSYIKSY